MLFNSNFRYTAYVITNESKETYESNDITAIEAVLNEYVELFGIKNGIIGLVDNTTGEDSFLKLREYAFMHLLTNTYKPEFLKKYFE